MADGVSITALIIAIFVLILLLLIIFFGWSRFSKFDKGVPYKVQVGANTSTDVFDLTKYNYYQVVYTLIPSATLTLSFNLPSSISSGQTVVITNPTNTTTANLTLPSGVTFTWPAGATVNSVLPGQTAWITFTSSTAAVVALANAT